MAYRLLSRLKVRIHFAPPPSLYLWEFAARITRIARACVHDLWLGGECMADRVVMLGMRRKALSRTSLAGTEHPPSISSVRRDGECHQLPAPQSAPMNSRDSRVRPQHYAVLASVRAAGPPRETPKSAAGT